MKPAEKGTACGGTGAVRYAVNGQLDDEPQPCAMCEGTGATPRTDAAPEKCDYPFKVCMCRDPDHRAPPGTQAEYLEHHDAAPQPPSGTTSSHVCTCGTGGPKHYLDCALFDAQPKMPSPSPEAMQAANAFFDSEESGGAVSHFARALDAFAAERVAEAVAAERRLHDIVVTKMLSRTRAAVEAERKAFVAVLDSNMTNDEIKAAIRARGTTGGGGK